MGRTKLSYLYMRKCQLGGWWFLVLLSLYPLLCLCVTPTILPLTLSWGSHFPYRFMYLQLCATMGYGPLQEARHGTTRHAGKQGWGPLKLRFKPKCLETNNSECGVGEEAGWKAGPKTVFQIYMFTFRIVKPDSRGACHRGFCFGASPVLHFQPQLFH